MLARIWQKCSFSACRIICKALFAFLPRVTIKLHINSAILVVEIAAVSQKKLCDATICLDSFSLVSRQAPLRIGG